jgi:DNA-directed RNA polymerase specialized sigma24 family protein
MERCTHDIDTRNILSEAMDLLAPPSRRLMELWLEGLNREEIAKELGLCEGTVAEMFDTAFRQLRVLLAQQRSRIG